MPTDDPLAALHALPDEYQRAMRAALIETLFAQLDELAAEARKAAESQSEPEQVVTVAA